MPGKLKETTGVRFSGRHELRDPMPSLVDHWFRIRHLDVERLLANWRWLCPGQRTLIARSAFGDLFLADEPGQISWLNVSRGQLWVLANAEPEFRELLENPENRNTWFGENDELGFAAKGLVPSDTQCIGFDVPLVFKEGATRKPYLVDIYENVYFLGDLYQQIAGVPDGSTIKLIVKPRPPAVDH